MKRRLPPWLVALPVLAVLACSVDPNDDENPLREDVLRCEDAVSNASGCCPALPVPEGACVYVHTVETCPSCSSLHGEPLVTDSRPVLSIDESRAIEDVSCAAVDCARIAALLARPHVSRTGGEGSCY